MFSGSGGVSLTRLLGTSSRSGTTSGWGCPAPGVLPRLTSLGTVRPGEPKVMPRVLSLRRTNERTVGVMVRSAANGTTLCEERSPSSCRLSPCVRLAPSWSSDLRFEELFQMRL